MFWKVFVPPSKKKKKKYVIKYLLPKFILIEISKAAFLDFVLCSCNVSEPLHPEYGHLKY